VLQSLTLLALISGAGCSAPAASTTPAVPTGATALPQATQTGAVITESPATETPVPPASPTIAATTPTETATPPPSMDPAGIVFDGERAYQDVIDQVALGPRTPGSEAHQKAGDWILDELSQAGWQVEEQNTERMGHPVRNLAGKRGQGEPWILIGAHYDSRLVANRDPQASAQTTPVPGANDGASGVAVLLELARTLPQLLDGRQGQIWLVFFDVEDQGSLPGWDWILGSQAFADSLVENADGKIPDAVVVADMIGDASLQIYQEKNSDPGLTAEIWQTADELGYSQAFIPSPRYAILDDHLPFIDAGIPAVDLIDFDYPYWHTTADTPDKVSAESLAIVGRTLSAWLLKHFS